jgi:hypothetical protein
MVVPFYCYSMFCGEYTDKPVTKIYDQKQDKTWTNHQTRHRTDETTSQIPFWDILHNEGIKFTRVWSEYIVTNTQEDHLIHRV